MRLATCCSALPSLLPVPGCSQTSPGSPDCGEQASAASRRNEVISDNHGDRRSHCLLHIAGRECWTQSLFCHFRPQEQEPGGACVGAGWPPLHQVVNFRKSFI